MSTRANVIILTESEEKVLYRHHDGYPTATGLDLFKVCVKASEDKESERCIDKRLTRNYEDTTGIHGDIDFLYRMRIRSRGIEGGYRRMLEYKDISKETEWTKVNKDLLLKEITAEEARVQSIYLEM